ncbi:MAG: HAD family phosphatase [Lachnospiraceae bacterium]|nr:HAD family phosphatase [Lachnospiraceae bacterium]
MLQNIKAVIFDVDGTLLDSNGVWQEIDEEFMEERDLDLTEDFQKEIDGMSFHQVAEYCHDTFNFEETPEELMDIWHDMARNEYTYNVKAKPGAKDFADFLKKNNIKMAIASSNSHELIDPGLKNNELYHHMDLFYTASNIGEAKDNPKIYQNIAKELGVEPEECLVFDDIIPVINAVNDAGMRSCVVLDQRSVDIYGKEALIECADYHINDFREIEYAGNNN